MVVVAGAWVSSPLCNYSLFPDLQSHISLKVPSDNSQKAEKNHIHFSIVNGTFALV